MKKHTRYFAARALCVMACNPGCSIREAVAVVTGDRPRKTDRKVRRDVYPSSSVIPTAIRLALEASLEAGSVQQQRAEAEAKLRTGWDP